MKPRGLSRVLWGISLPIMFAQVSEIVLHVTNTIFLARVGIVELGAIGIADAIWEVFVVAPLGLVDGIQILTARHLGRRQPEAAGAVFNQGLLLILLAGAALSLLLRASVAGLSGWLVSSSDVGRATVDYLRIAAFGLPFVAANFAYSALLTSLGRTRVLVPATVLLAVTNCALDVVLIFGKLGMPALGMRGAGWASVGSELVTFVFLTGSLVRLGEARRLHLFRFGAWRRKVVRRLVRISAPVAGQTLVESLRWFGFFLILEHVGAAALAVGNVVYVCYEVFRVPAEAFAEATCSMVSRFVGRDRPHRIEGVIHRSIAAAALATLPMVALGLLFPDRLLAAFTLDHDLVGAGIAGVRVVALAMVVVIPADMWFNAVVGTGDTPAALGIELFLTAVMLSMAYLTAIVLPGGALVWTSLAAAALAALAISYAWFRSGRWRRALA